MGFSEMREALAADACECGRTLPTAVVEVDLVESTGLESIGRQTAAELDGRVFASARRVAFPANRD